ncbi:MAG: hypothetical protein KGD65_14975 [Candidatus Lokiarchaeota archaeon]|nr:hypothetical protein [Candidatus Lokiarchaeota archaeon]
MSKIQESDKIMRITAIFGGVVALVESFLELIGFGLMPYGIGILSGLLGLLFAALAILLGFKPIHYTPVFLGILGILLLIFAILIGGIIILIAAIIGAVS